MKDSNKPDEFIFLEPHVKIDNTLNLPPILAGLPLPYEHLDDRRFEELIYSLFKSKIKHDDTFRDRYDNIQLMQGVGEKGRDCALFKANLFTGIVQCKKYKKSLDLPTCLNEIVKPLLHAVLGNLKISKPVNFQYMLIATNGFSNPANEMLGEFSLFVENNLPSIESAFNALKGKYTSFSTLDYSKVSNKLIALLKQVQIIPFQRIDIDTEINQPWAEHIKKTFFRVETVTDNSVIEKLREEVIKAKAIPLEAILQNFETASLQLKNYRSSFETSNQFHINRSETSQIVDWLLNPLKDKSDPVLLLVGAPGDGKSVILKDTLLELQFRNIPVIALKADKYVISSLSDLQAKANLPASIEACLYRVLEREDIVTIIIDQLDAVAGSVTSERACIDIYNQLIHTAKRIRGVRIIISIRRFELEYDYEFSNYNRYEKVPVTTLSNKQVATVLNLLGIRKELISKSLYDLLSNANTLNVFCKVCKQAANPTNLLSLHALYDELWRQILRGFSGNSNAVQSCLFSLANQINQEHSLTLPSKAIADVEVKEYLIRNEILFEADNSIQFFHQTFYDYSFAKSFLSENRPIRKYLQSEHQGLYVRPPLKMILAFLRQESAEKYIEIMRALLSKRDIRWHLKLLILTILGFEEAPVEQEITLIEQVILPNSDLWIPFIEAARGKAWLTILIRNNILDRLIFPEIMLLEKISSSDFIQRAKHLKLLPQAWLNQTFLKRKENWISVAFTFLRNNLPHNRKSVLEYLEQLQDFEGNSAFISRLLLSLKLWDQENAKKIFLKYAISDVNLLYLRVNILEDVASFDRYWTLEQLENATLKHIDTEGSKDDSMIDHCIAVVAKKLIELYPEGYFNFSLKIIKVIVERRKTYFLSPSSTYKIQRDLAYDYYHYENSNEYGDELYLSTAISAAKSLCAQKNQFYQNFLNSSLTENSETILRIALISLLEAPENYINLALKLLRRIISIDCIQNSHLYFHARHLLKKLFPMLPESDQAGLLLLIKEASYQYEIGTFEIQGKVRHYNESGKINLGFFSEIDEREIFKNASVKDTYLQLKRRFDTVENTAKNKISIVSIGAPMEEFVYKKMNFENWEKSFLKYGDNLTRDWTSDKGGIDEHSNAFEIAVKADPDHFLPFVKKIITENKVSFEYQIKGLTGLKDTCEFHDFYPLFETIATRDNTLHAINRIIRLADFFKNHAIHPWVFDFLYRYSFEENEYSGKEENDRIKQQVRESAIYRLFSFAKEEKYAYEILKGLEKNQEKFNTEIKNTILSRLVLFLKWDKSQVEILFQKLYKQNDGNDTHRYGMQLVQYLVKSNYALVQSFLEQALKFENCQKDAAILIATAFLKGHSEAKKLLEYSWRSYAKCRAAMVDVALLYYNNSNGSISEKAIWLYNRFLEDRSQEVIGEYSTSFLHRKSEEFNSLLPLLKNYVVSYVASQGPGYFFEYISKCSKISPVECLKLLKSTVGYGEISITKGTYYDGKQPIIALVTCYNHLQSDPLRNEKYILMALDLFDKFLKQPFYRIESEVALGELMK